MFEETSVDLTLFVVEDASPNPQMVEPWIFREREKCWVSIPNPIFWIQTSSQIIILSKKAFGSIFASSH